jgi:hypothetical protein
MLLFVAGGCAQIPEFVRVDVDGSTLEFKKKPAPPGAVPAPPAPDQPAPTSEPPAAPDAGPR